MWGAEDLIASLGGRSSRGDTGRYRDVARFARAQVLLAAGASGRFAIDAVHLDIGDLEGLEEEARDAVASGFSGTACIHPTQAAVVRRAYRPTEKEISWAHRIVDAAVTAKGVFAFEGQMVDAPLLQHAHTILKYVDQGPARLDRG
jgi:citrate lyase subunit beta/citryl-CoA lyase